MVVSTKAGPSVVSPLVAAPQVVAQSSQVFARNYNGIVPFAPLTLPAPAPIVPAPFFPAPVPVPFSPFAPIPSRVVAPFSYPYYPFAPFTRPFLY